MRRDLTTRPTQRNGGGHAQDIARERRQSPPQKRTRPPPRRRRDGMSERLRQGLQQEQTREKVTDPRRGRTKQRGKNSRWLAATGRATASAPAAPGRQENRHEEAEASPKGEVSKPKWQPADRSQSRVGEPGSRPMVRGAQWREPRIPQNPQPQRGTPGKRAPAAVGRKAEAPTPAGRKEGRVRKTTPDP